MASLCLRTRPVATASLGLSSRSEGTLKPQIRLRRGPASRVNVGIQGRPRRDVRVRAASTKSLIPSHGYDYYELLGLDTNAAQSDIKRAYRRLQKRCHPDVAGREDMAILLNEAYSTLSDPITRFAYDQLRVTWLRDDSFLGKPIYSTWHGSEEEETAAFVDETMCIGCLKCATIAPKTFAIETKHGRARAVRQWADDEATIGDAMLSCPVSCIKWVERSKLAALEHIMSTMPRPSLYSVRVGGDGVRMPDVYNEAEKFLQKRKKNESEIEDAREKRERSRGAFDAIRGWWGGGNRTAAAGQGDNHAGPAALVLVLRGVDDAAGSARASREALGGDFVPEDLRALHDAASTQRAPSSGGFFNLRVGDDEEEYWDPTKPLFADTTKRTAHRPNPAPTGSAAGPGGSARNVHSSRTSTATHAYACDNPVDGSEGQDGADNAALWMNPPVAPDTQFIRLDEWPDFKAEMERQKHDEVHHALALFPILLSVAAGGYTWLSTGANDPASQAAAVAALQASAGAALVPAEVAASSGMQLALCMGVWYAVGAVASQSVRLAAALFWGRGGER